MVFFFEPLRRVLAVMESLVMCASLLFSTGQTAAPGDYLTKLNRMGLYSNSAQQSLPQTALHNIVLNHFNQTRGKTPKCLIIGFDGARADALADSINEPKSGIQELRRGGGAVYQMYAGGKFPYLQATVTACGWTTLLTGHWAKEPGGGGHRVTANGVTKAANAPKLIFTELLEQKKVKKSAFVVSWGGHFADDNAVYLNDMADNKAAKNNALWLTMPDDAGTFARTKQELCAKDGADIVMCILEYCDHAGHGSGFGSQNPEYEEAIRAADSNAYDLIAAVKARPTYAKEDWLILITSDHGGVGKGHGGQFAVERQIFLATNKA
ncbi:MAG: alkaline phosphatase family protein [Oscillospiraceae bacterium]|jgi:predicted AlkP superfamily pyrophosphatase or phosphodiesterase|nr:alkaline phosphatase family protein [Oscillospiraceae bacterium]